MHKPFLRPGGLVTICMVFLCCWSFGLPSRLSAGDKPGKPFYGIVLDLEDTPVPDAAVSIDIRHSGQPVGTNIRVFRTGTDGRFEIDDRTLPPAAPSMKVTDISKPGYVYNLRELPSFVTLFDLFTDTTDRYHPDPEKPAILRVRKMAGKPTFVLKYNCRELSFRSAVAPKRDVGVLYCDFAGDAVRDTKPENGSWFVLSATELREQQSWEITIRPLGGIGGTIVSDKCLFAAPQDGYQNEVTLRLPWGKSDLDQPWLYFKTSPPVVYGRLHVRSIAERTGRFFFLRVDDYRVNPYGGCVLEHRTDIPAGIENQLRDVMRAKLREGKAVAEPDIDAIIAGDKAAQKNDTHK